MNTFYERTLADYKGESVNDYYTEIVKGYDFISTAGHGYLVVKHGQPNYTKALKIVNNSNFSYKIGTTVFLEEDCDATAFLKEL